MKINYTVAQQFVARLLLISLCLQSCGGGFGNNSLIPIREEQLESIQPHIQEFIPQTNVESLFEQELTAQGGHAVTFYEEADGLKAEVIEKSGSFSRTHMLPVYIEPSISLKEACKKEKLQVILPRKHQPGYVYIGGLGLKGGMQVGNEEEEPDPEAEEKEEEGNRKKEAKIKSKKARRRTNKKARRIEAFSRKSKEEIQNQQNIKGKEKIIEEEGEGISNQDSVQSTDETTKVLSAINKEEVLYTRNKHLQTPLHIAAILGNIQTAKNLIEKSTSDIDAQDDTGNTPLHEAAKRGYEKIVSLLLEHGALPIANKSKKIPLELAVENGHIEIVDMLASQLTLIYEEFFANINSCEELNETRENIDVAIHLRDILFKILSEPYSQQGKPEYLLIITKVFSELYPYIKDIIEADFFKALLVDDRIKLANLFYDINQAIAIAHLGLIANILLPIYLMEKKIELKEHIQGYKDAKSRLKTMLSLLEKKKSNEQLNQINKTYNTFQNKVIGFDLCFNPSLTLEDRFKLESIKFCNKVLPIMNIRAHEIRIKELSFRKPNLKNEDWKELCEEFLQLEKLSLCLVATKQSSSIQAEKNILGSSIDNLVSYSEVDINNPTVDNLVNSYKNKKVIKLLPKDIFTFVFMGITLFIITDQPDKALLRIQAMERFLNLTTSEIPKDLNPMLKNIIAVGYAFCGKYEKLSQLHQSEIKEQLAALKRMRLKEEKHQQLVEKIKNAQNDQSNLNLSSPNFSKTVARSQSLNTVTSINEVERLNEVVILEQQELRKQNKQARLKRHQEAEEERMEQQLLEASHIKVEAQPTFQELEITAQLQDLVLSESASLVHFLLPQKDFNTLHQIFNEDWKITRGDIEHLFKELGQTINTSTKSSHHIINISSGITLINNEGEIIGIITELSANMGGNLSLPDWDKEKIVPLYMRRSIKKFLSRIGINKNNYSKATRETYIQFVPGQSSSSTSQSDPKIKADAHKKGKK